MSESIHVALRLLSRAAKFYMTHSPMSVAYARASWAQYGEDLLIADLVDVKRKGFYVDVGAYNPFNLSNTYYFYRLGWRGINIDPLPKAHARLNRFRTRDVNLQIAITPRKSSYLFRVDDVFSRLETTPHPGCTNGMIQVMGLPLSDVLNKQKVVTASFQKMPNFLTVDCEGSEIEVLLSNNWKQHPFAVVAVEDHSVDFQESAISRFMRDLGYSIHGRTKITTIFKR